MLDPQNEIFDRRLARHLISLYYVKKTDETEEDGVDKSIVSIIIKINYWFKFPLIKRIFLPKRLDF